MRIAAQRRAAWNKGLSKENDERIKKISDALTGIKRSEETIAKIRIAQRIRYAKADHPWKNPENEEKRRRVLVGHPVSKETREKLRKAHLGKPEPQRDFSKLEEILCV